MKLSQIKQDMPRSANIQIIAHDTLIVLTISHFTDFMAVLSDNSEIPLTSPLEFEVVNVKFVENFKKHSKKKNFASILTVEFIGENDFNFSNKIWPTSYRDEMLACPIMQGLFNLANMGVLEVMNLLLLSKPANETWFTQERKDYYLKRLQQGLELYS